MWKILPVLLMAGCMMSNYRQQGLALILDDTIKTNENINKIAESAKLLITEIIDAKKEDRVPNIVESVTQMSQAMEDANKHLVEISKTINVMQEDIGISSTPIPTDDFQKEAWRAQYRAIAKLWKMIKSSISSRLGIPKLDKPSMPVDEPFGTGALSGILASIMGALGLGSYGAAKGIKHYREIKGAAGEGQSLANLLKSKMDESDFKQLMRNDHPNIATRHKRQVENGN